MAKAQYIVLAGVEGIEPSSGVLETLILPMNYTPIFVINFTINFCYCQSKTFYFLIFSC